MDFVSGVSSTYDFSVYAQRQAGSSENRQKKTSVSEAGSFSEEDTFFRTSKTTQDENKTGSATQDKPDYKISSPGKELTEEESKKVQELKSRDKEVRDHEQAHQRVGGSITGQAKYTYEAGPDGKQYAVGGSVPIDMSEEETPEATISKAQLVRRTALAPKDPSAQDRKVAQEASQMENEARTEVMAATKAATQSYSSVQKMNTSQSSDSPKTTGIETSFTLAPSTEEGIPYGVKAEKSSGITQTISNTTSPYTELSNIMSKNRSSEGIAISASKTRNLDQLTGKKVDLFG